MMLLSFVILVTIYLLIRKNNGDVVKIEIIPEFIDKIVLPENPENLPKKSPKSILKKSEKKSKLSDELFEELPRSDERRRTFKQVANGNNKFWNSLDDFKSYNECDLLQDIYMKPINRSENSGLAEFDVKENNLSTIQNSFDSQVIDYRKLGKVCVK